MSPTWGPLATSWTLGVELPAVARKQRKYQGADPQSPRSGEYPSVGPIVTWSLVRAAQAQARALAISCSSCEEPHGRRRTGRVLGLNFASRWNGLLESQVPYWAGDSPCARGKCALGEPGALGADPTWGGSRRGGELRAQTTAHARNSVLPCAGPCPAIDWRELVLVGRR